MSGLHLRLMLAGMVALVALMAASEALHDKREAKRRREVVRRLRELVRDRQSFLCGDEDNDKIYLADIEALEYAIKALEEGM